MPEVWVTILEGWDALGRRITQNPPTPSADATGKVPVGDVTVLERLRTDLRAIFGQLAIKLQPLLGDPEVLRQVLEPLVIHTDERVLVRLPPPLGPSWPRLQHDVIHSDDGGVVFYHRVDHLLAKSDPSPLVLEVYYFCLKEGFCGRWVNDRQRIDEYKVRLAKAIAPESPIQPSQTRPPAIATPVRHPRSRLYYAIGIALAVLIPVGTWIVLAL